MNKTTVIGLAVSILIIGIIAYFINGQEVPCDKAKCEERLGLKKGQSDNLISDFEQNNDPKIEVLNVYIEASRSMDGYVKNENSVFKLVIKNIGNHIDSDSVAFNFIGGASESTTILSVPREYIKNITPSTFDKIAEKNREARRNTDTNCMVDSILARWTPKDVSILITDAVFSPNGSDGLKNHVSNMKTDMRKAIERKMKDNPNFTVLIYRLKSGFEGKYYIYNNSEISIDQDRPFYVFIFGDRAKLTRIKQSLDNDWRGYSFVEKSDDAFSFVATGPVTGGLIPEYVPYEVIGNKHLFHIVEAKTNRNGLYTVKVRANLSSIPYSGAYLMDKSNYKIGGNNNYRVDSITLIPNNADRYTHEFTIVINGKPRENVSSNTQIEFSLLAPVFDEKSLDNINDTTNDYTGINVPENTTFMIKPLIQGVYEAYGLIDENNRKRVVTFKAFIN